MNLMNRRSSLSLIIAGFASVVGASRAKAQWTEQQIRNGAQVTATGDVTLNQSASGQQGVYIDGVLQTEDGIYRTSTGQVIMNDGQVTATGDVVLNQSASGNQQVRTEVRQSGMYDGIPAGTCQVGAVIADPDGILYFQKADCCWYLVPCMPCKEKKQCQGDYCGS